MRTTLIHLGQDPRNQAPLRDLNYVREFDASVLERGPDFVVLDTTVLYPEGGGQPFDTGVLRWPAGETRVNKVVKEKGDIRHYVSDVPPVDRVHGMVDWDRRYAHMRMHTSQHLVSGLVYDRFKARTVGNHLYTDYAHIDFSPVNFSDEDLRAIEAEVNVLAAKGIEVDVYEEDRATLEATMDAARTNLDMIPASVRRLRVIRIGGFDLCPCGGTHIRNTREIGGIRIMRRRSKGKGIDRVTYELDPPPLKPGLS